MSIQTRDFQVGSLVRCRDREWIVQPSKEQDVIMLRPLGGIEAESCGIYIPIEGHLIEQAHFSPPNPANAGDFVSGQLLRDAARLALRSGAGPFRSLGRLGIRPRPYQLVPLMMALRLDPVRLLIADDVGIGKTIEAGLIARELLDRGEIQRLTVLCPPHLCEQWQRELHSKFNIDAVVLRSSTAAALERSLPRSDSSIFEYYPFTIASIDYLKSERRRDNFLRSCPEFVIIDEAHAATYSSGTTQQQQRHDLLRELAADARRHVLLLTATPHSGIESAFVSLLGLLRPSFAQLSMDALSESQRDELARHFVQRRRADVQRWLGTHDVTPFPSRETAEITYSLPRSSEYRALFNDVYAFTRELVRQGMGSQQVWQLRARYWAALALLRCVMSSPAAAAQALRNRSQVLSADDQLTRLDTDELFASYVYDPSDQEAVQDLEPALVLEQASSSPERERLNRFAQRATALKGAGDAKLQRLFPMIEELLRDGFHPIVYCRYIATANYLAEELKQRLKGMAELRIVSVTGERSEGEREAMIADLEQSPRRLLIATDCLSEGINLQQAFDAVIHYDLPWNPNRLEQREGRVDRYGQPNAKVRTVLLYGDDNPMDEAVMKVLLRKAVNIHRSLGISVPLPLDSSSVLESLIASLFTPAPQQSSMFDELGVVEAGSVDQSLAQVEQAWTQAVEREKESRTRFAQRRMRPEEVARELEESDAVLGTQADVERFVRAACERLGANIAPAAGHLLLASANLPLAVRERIESLLLAPRKGQEPGLLPISFADMAAQGVQQVNRNHPLTAALADYMLEQALIPGEAIPPAARCGLIRSNAVSKRSVLLLLRIRMLLKQRLETPRLAEELVLCGYTRSAGENHWLEETEALRLLQEAHPAANVSADERSLGLQSVLGQLDQAQAALNALAETRAQRLRESHARVRSAIGGGQISVTAHLPPDVLGVYVLLPT